MSRENPLLQILQRAFPVEEHQGQAALDYSVLKPNTAQLTLYDVTKWVIV